MKIVPLEILKNNAQFFNENPSCVGSTEWIKFKEGLKGYFQDRKVSEISVNALFDLTGLEKHIGKKLLIEMNSEYFINKNNH